MQPSAAAGSTTGVIVSELLSLAASSCITFCGGDGDMVKMSERFGKREKDGRSCEA